MPETCNQINTRKGRARKDMATNPPSDDGGEYNGDPYGKEATSEGGDNTVIYYSTDGGETWTEEVPTRTEVGETNVIVKAEDPNHETVTDEYVIVVTRKAVTVTVQDASKTYGEADPKFTATESGLIGTDKVTYTISRTNAAENNAGTYEDVLEATGQEIQGNYTVVYVPADFTINKASGLVVKDKDRQRHRMGKGSTRPTDHGLGNRRRTPELINTRRRHIRSDRPSYRHPYHLDVITTHTRNTRPFLHTSQEKRQIYPFKTSRKRSHRTTSDIACHKRTQMVGNIRIPPHATHHMYPCSHLYRHTGTCP